MIKKLSLIPVFIFCFFTANVYAQEGPGRSPTGNTNLDRRVTERIQRLQTDLDTGQVQALKASCQAAQNRLNAIKTAASNYTSAQNKRIDKIINNVTRLSENLSQQGTDTVRLDQTLEEITGQRSRIDSTYENYRLALDDSVKIDCEAVPEGFRASVNDAKTQFSQLREQRKTFRESIKTELKNTLVELRNSL